MARGSYSASISRDKPTAFVFLLDQSGSMSEHLIFDGEPRTKAEALAKAANALIDELLDRTRRDGGFYDYYHIAIISYSGEGVRDLFNGFVTPSQMELCDVPTQTIIHERCMLNGRPFTTSYVQRQWIRPVASGMTPMYEALSRALTLVDGFCSQEQYRRCYPPTIFNITDGEATDASEEQLLGIAEQIKRVSTIDGSVILANMHLSKNEEPISVLFPSSMSKLPQERYARLLYKMSSDMPQKCNIDIIHMCPDAIAGPFRAMSYNATISDIVSMLNIGTIKCVPRGLTPIDDIIKR